MTYAQPQLFDLDAMARSAAAEAPWFGLPLEYTAEYHHLEDLQAAFDRYVAIHGNFDCLGRSHMWHQNRFEKPLLLDDHELHVLTACTACDYDDHDHSATPLPAPGTSGYQANCPRCRWHHIGGEDEVIKAWYDHAMPGWRDLPTFPDKLAKATTSAAARAWAEEHYPLPWQRPGAPILTERTPWGTRNVPGRSPFGGYDLCIASTDPKTGIRTPR